MCRFCWAAYAMAPVKQYSAASILRVARAAGIDAVYGAPFGPLEVVPVPDALASTFGAAHQRVHGRRAAIHRGDGAFVLPAVDVGPRHVVEAGSAEALVAAALFWRGCG